jgi:hypothetical protein
MERVDDLNFYWPDIGPTFERSVAYDAYLFSVLICVKVNESWVTQILPRTIRMQPDER